MLTQLLKEELTRTDENDIKRMIKSELDDSLKDIEKKLENKEMEAMISEVVADMLEQYHKVMWQRRKYWSGAIKK